MDRRDALKTLGLAAAGSVAATAAASEAEAQVVSAQPGVFATPRDPADPLDPFLTNVLAIPDDYFIPGRFAGKAVIVTGCARGMGRMATLRLAREGANVVGVDWLQDEGAAVVADVLAEVRHRVAVVIPPPFNRFQNSFSHVFSGGYAAGYYSYKWAEVLSADAYGAFEEAQGDPNRLAETGLAFQREILAVGGSRSAMESFTAFRGREPSIDALLRHNGMTH